MSRTHARFVTADTGVGLVIEQSGSVLANDAATDGSLARAARAIVGVDEFRHFTEFLLFGPGPYSNSVSLGIMQSGSSLANYVGSEATSYGYRAGEGAIYNNGAVLQGSLATAGDGDIIGIYIDLGTDPAAITWYKNGVVLHTLSLGAPPHDTWHIGASLAGFDLGDVRAYLNAGQRRFQHPIGSVNGWYELSPPLAAMRFATADYMTGSADTPPHTAYAPVMVGDGLSISREISFWPFSGRADLSTQFSSLEILDPDGMYDALMTQGVSGIVVHISVVEKGQPLSTAQRIATAVLRSVESRGDAAKVLHLDDYTSTVDCALQAQYFLPNSVAAANQPWPIAIGAVRNYEPVLVDETTSRFAISDAPVSSLGDVRVRGKRLDPLVPDYTLSASRRHVEFAAAPEGKITVEVSSLGDASVSGATDLFGGIGDPFTDTAPNDGVPDGWDEVGSSNGTTDPTVNPNFPWLEFPSDYFNLAWSALTTLSLTPGGTYMLQTRFIDSPAGNIRPELWIELHAEPRIAEPGQVSRRVATYRLPQDQPDDPHVSVTFTVPESWPASESIPYLVIHHNNYNGPTDLVVMEHARIFELPDAFAALELEGTNLETTVSELLTARAGLTPDQWSQADCQAIDAATQYQAGYYTGSPVSALRAVASTLDSWTAALFADRNGVIRFLRLDDPAMGTPVATLDEGNMLAPVEVRPDLGAGLTNALHARRNWAPYRPADFGDTTLAEVTQATRRALHRDFQTTVSNAADLPSVYVDSRLAQPVDTNLDRADHAQAELDRVLALYQVPRYVYNVRVAEEPTTWYEIGDVVLLDYPRHGLVAGKQLLVIGVHAQPLSQTFELTLWG